MSLKNAVLSSIFLAVSFMVPVISTTSVIAAEGDSCTLTGSFLGLPTWYKYLNAEEDSTGRCSPVLKGANQEQRVNSSLPIGLAALEGILRISGVVAVVMIFVAGFRFILSQGNPDAATAARKTAINAIIGLVIIVLATSLVSFIGSALIKASPPTSIGVNLS